MTANKLHGTLSEYHPMLQRLQMKIDFIDRAVGAFESHREEALVLGGSSNFFDGQIGDGY